MEREHAEGTLAENLPASTDMMFQAPVANSFKRGCGGRVRFRVSDNGWDTERHGGGWDPVGSGQARVVLYLTGHPAVGRVLGGGEAGEGGEQSSLQHDSFFQAHAGPDRHERESSSSSGKFKFVAQILRIRLVRVLIAAHPTPRFPKPAV